MTLNPRHHAFVVAYLGVAAGNATEAARMAGYKKPETEGCRLLKRADVSAVVTNRQTVTISRAIASREEVLEVLSGIVRGEIGDSTIPTDLAGMPVVDKDTGEQVVVHTPPKPSDRTKAAAQMAKMQGWDRKKPIDGVEDLRGKHPLEVVALMRAKADELEANALRQIGKGEEE